MKSFRWLLLIIVAIVFISFPFILHATSGNNPKQNRYKVATISKFTQHDVENLLNEHAQKGWKFLNANGGYYHFEKELLYRITSRFK